MLVPPTTATAESTAWMAADAALLPANQLAPGAAQPLASDASMKRQLYRRLSSCLALSAVGVPSAPAALQLRGLSFHRLRAVLSGADHDAQATFFMNNQEVGLDLDARAI